MTGADFCFGKGRAGNAETLERVLARNTGLRWPSPPRLVLTALQGGREDILQRSA